MNTGAQDGFRFGLETEFLLVDANSFRPLWHPDLQFETLNPIDLLPKGVQIRTPVHSSIEECLGALKVLHSRLQHALANVGLQAVALSFHPTEVDFSGPQSKRRYDYWQ